MPARGATQIKAGIREFCGWDVSGPNGDQIKKHKRDMVGRFNMTALKFYTNLFGLDRNGTKARMDRHVAGAACDG